MPGDFTSVPLRPADRWTAARMQQGRVLLDTDWNLTVDGGGRDVRALARDAIGFAGVPNGSSAFRVDVVSGAFTIRAGVMWIDGLAARNPADLAFGAQPEIPPLPATGLAVLYLDAFVEEIQAAEDEDLLDPALDPVDTTTRTRVGWRVRAEPTSTPMCSSVTLPPPFSTGTLDVVQTSPAPALDPCAPPDDPRSGLPDGLLRIEVIDAGTELTARFAWSYSGGSEAVSTTAVAGAAVTLVPSPSVVFRPNDLAELSTSNRRADRRDHGPLHTVSAVAPQSGADEVTLGAPVTVTQSPGLCLRRWDGETSGAAGGVVASIDGADVGVTFTARPGTYLVGDWWGCRVRGSARDSVETLTAAAPDGVRHASTPLAVVDLASMTVVQDCRRFFPSLVDIRGGTCTVTAFPGDDLQAALDALPVDGGKLCLAKGVYEVRDPLTVGGKRRILIEGVGPSTVLVGSRHEAVLIATECEDVEITRVRVESGIPKTGRPQGEEHLLGALTFLGGDRIRVRDCQVSCPDAPVRALGRAQSCIYVADSKARLPGEVELRGNRLEVGDQQVGILVVSAEQSTIVDNEVVLRSTRRPLIGVNRLVAGEFGRFVATHLRDSGAGGRPITLPDGSAASAVGSPEIRGLSALWARRASPGRLARTGSGRADLARFVSAALMESHSVAVSAATGRFLAAAVRDVRAIGQAIVVAGSRASIVRIEGNTVRGAIQGIHVGVQVKGPGQVSAERVVIDRNVVVCRVPFFWRRQRHAIYVGNVHSLVITDNRAALVLTGGSVDGTGTDAVRIWGAIGGYLQVRGLDATGGFRAAVMLRDTTPGGPSAPFIRYVCDVLNADGAQALDAPGSVTRDRCLP